jgi:hypothetical protein
MMMKHGMKSLVAAAMVALLSSAASAGTIATSPAPVPSGPGLGIVSVAAILTPNPNNDNQTGGGISDNDLLITLKRFDSKSYIDIVFTVNPSDGITEYKVTEFVDNNSNANWSSYKMQLGTGTGTSFVLSPSTDQLDFDAPNYDLPPTSGAFGTIGTSPDELTFSGGSQGSGAQQYTFRLDIPDLSQTSTFTLRQIPTAVPEPNTFALIGMVLCGFIARRRTY